MSSHKMRDSKKPKKFKRILIPTTTSSSSESEIESQNIRGRIKDAYSQDQALGKKFHKKRRKRTSSNSDSNKLYSDGLDVSPSHEESSNASSIATKSPANQAQAILDEGDPFRWLHEPRDDYSGDDGMTASPKRSTSKQCTPKKTATTTRTTANDAKEATTDEETEIQFSGRDESNVGNEQDGDEDDSDSCSRTLSSDEDEMEDVVVTREIEIPLPECSEAVEEESDDHSSSSESTPEADVTDVEDMEAEIEEASFSFMDISCVPILTPTYQFHTKYLEMKISSTTQFSVRIFVETHTLREIQMYPKSLLEQFCARISAQDGRYDVQDGAFIFEAKKNTYETVMDILSLSPFPLVRVSSGEVCSNDDFRKVVEALAGYYQRNDIDLENDFDEIDQQLENFRLLRHYQKESVAFAIRRKGRCMFADESRMGKGVEAIVASTNYRNEWPLLVMCSTSLQEYWNSELRKWVPGIPTVVNLTTEDECTSLAKGETMPDIVIIGYKLLQCGVEHLKDMNFKVVIVDECHKIKHAWTKTAKSARRIIRRAKRRFLLTANPAFGVPVELFRQLHVINRVAFQDCEEFADRYCGYEERYVDLELSRLPSRRWKDAINLSELKHLLLGTVMTRHHFEDIPRILLPVKYRQKVILDFRPDVRMKRILGEYFDESRKNLQELEDLKTDTGNNKVFRWFKHSGGAKLMLICQYLNELDFESKKIVIYARHQFVLNGIEKFLRCKRIKFVRIRGKYEKRQSLSTKFNERNSIRVALLSFSIVEICAELPAGDLVVFTELFWIPDILFRNENRVCQLQELFNSERPARKKFEVKYLIAEERGSQEQLHFDTHLWEMLMGKTNALAKMGLLGANDNLADVSIPELVFEPDPNNRSLDDFQVDEMPIEENDGEYNPLSDDDGESDNDSVSSGTASEDMITSDENCSEPEPDESEELESAPSTPVRAKEYESSSSEEAEQNQSQATPYGFECDEDLDRYESESEESNESPCEETPVVITPGRTRSASAKIIAQTPTKDRHDDSDSHQSDDIEEPGEIEEVESEERTSSSDEEDKRKLHTPQRKKGKISCAARPQKKFRTKRQSGTSETPKKKVRTQDHTSTSETESEDSETYEREVKKSCKSLFR